MNQGEMGNSLTMYKPFEYVEKLTILVNPLKALLDQSTLLQLQIGFFQSNI